MMIKRASLTRPARMSQLRGRKRIAPVAVLSESADMALGSQMPDFTLVDATSKKAIRLSEYTKGAKASIVM